MLGFLVGLLVGLAILMVYRIRYGARLKTLLQRMRVQSTSRVMTYESQIASAIATQTNEFDLLREQIANFRQVLKLAPIGYLELDEENRLLWCNPKAQELLAIHQIDFDPPRLLLAIVRSYELDHLVERTRQTQTACQQDWTFHSISPDPANVSERPAYSLRGYGMPLNQGRVGVFLENRQEALLLAHQRDRWTSDVAHELKTPLTSIRLVGETLKPRVDPSLTTWVERLLNEVYRLSNLVDDVLNLSQLEQLTEPCPIDESTDIVQLLRQAWQSLEPLAQQKKLRFQYEGPAQLGVEVNPSLMHRVFVNLFDNAIKYSPAGQMIQAKLSLTTGDLAGFSADVRHLLIEVIDAGPGFAAKDLPYIFDRFYRADPARSREQPQAGALASSSTGLGLSIVQKIVASHQGLTQAQNHPETHGGWLRIWLPGKRVKDLVQSGPA